MINVGLMQYCDVNSMVAGYQGSGVLISSLNGNTYLDKMANASNSDTPYYDGGANATISHATADSGGEFSATIGTSDTPSDGAPITLAQDHSKFPANGSSFLTTLAMEWDFTTYVVASTSDTQVGANAVYTGLYAATWAFDATGTFSQPYQATSLWQPTPGTADIWLTPPGSWVATVGVPMQYQGQTLLNDAITSEKWS
jgi:hypothetical protein